ncbi:hypothetical protein C8R45DRAFT_812580, partial [Mycena sanguinolenta]
MDSWADVKSWQKIALALILKHQLNDKQILAFLLLVDSIGSQSETEHILEPFRMLVTGPGGTGKSRLFEAWTEFHELIDANEQLRLTGPTGIVATDIGGSTIHSLASL